MPVETIEAKRPPATATPEQAEQDRKAALHKEALDRFRICSNSEQDERERANKAFNYNAGNHMDDDKRRARLNAKPERPVVELNRTAPAVKRVVNNFRQAPPAGKVLPYGEKASKDAADMLQGYVRTIKNVSNATAHQETALEDAAIGGLSWIGILLEYEQPEVDEDSGPAAFFMRPTIRSFDTPFRVYRDPMASAVLLFRDARYFFVTSMLSKEAYRQKYGKRADEAQSFAVLMDDKKLWWTNEEVRVAEYWYVTSDQVEICLLKDNRVVARKDLQPNDKVINSRIVERNRKVHQVVMSGDAILEENDWPGRLIPLIPYIGNRFIENGIEKIVGMVTKTAMSANNMLDYAMTRLAEVLGLTPLSPWMVAFESIPPEFADQWARANTDYQSFLPYMARDEQGNALPAPSRISMSADIAGLVGSIGVAIDAIKAEMDTYDASLGASSGADTSGKQTALRQAAGDLGHFHIIDNAARAEELLTWMLIELAPKLYNRDGLLKITDPDGSTRDVVTVPVQTGNPKIGDAKLVKQKGADALFEINPIEYSIVATVGPNYPTRRQEQNKFVLDLIKLLPEAAAPLLPTLLRSSDGPDADKMADIIDPQAKAEIPPQAQQKMAELQGLVQKLTEALHASENENEQKQLDRDSKERIAALNSTTQVVIQELKLGLDELKETLAFYKHQAQNLSQPGVEPEPGQALPSAAPQSALPAPQEPVAEPAIPAPPVPPEGAPQ